jgi:hypothetical protein
MSMYPCMDLMQTIGHAVAERRAHLECQRNYAKVVAQVKIVFENYDEVESTIEKHIRKWSSVGGAVYDAFGQPGEGDASGMLGFSGAIGFTYRGNSCRDQVGYEIDAEVARLQRPLRSPECRFIRNLRVNQIKLDYVCKMFRQRGPGQDTGPMRDRIDYLIGERDQIARARDKYIHWQSGDQ